MNSIFCKLKKAKKTCIESFASLKRLKNMNLIFCKLQKAQKNMSSILCELKKAQNHFFFASLKNVKKHDFHFFFFFQI